VLEVELRRLDQLQAAVSDAAAKGDPDAIRSSLQIMKLRGRYLGLFSDGKGGGQHVHLDVGTSGSREPLQIVFCRSP
jgi:hypothetical protein